MVEENVIYIYKEFLFSYRKNEISLVLKKGGLEIIILNEIS